MAAKSSPSTNTSPRTRRRGPVDPVTRYAEDVTAGRIVAGRLVRLACARHLTDLQEGAARGLTWRLDLALYAIRFFPFLRHSKGEWGGQPFELSLWQMFCVGSVFGWLRRNGERRFRVIYEEVARKNGKSSLLAGVGIYALVADHEPGAEIYTAATKKDQARIIFDEAKRMVRASPDLRSRVGIYKTNLSVDATSSKFEPLSSDDRTLDGLNPHVVLIDELHKHRSRALLDVMDSAVGARRQPLLWIITTAGDDDPESVYANEHAYAEKVLEGVVQDDGWFVYIATIDLDDRWDDPACWIKANPNLHVSVKLDDLERQAAKARHSPPSQSEFKRLRLNVRQSGSDQAIDMDVWRRNSCGPFDPDEMRGGRCFAGLDLSSKIDLSAWVKLFEPADGDDRWRIVARFWMPADTVSEKADRDQAQYQRWIDLGLIETTPGNVIDHDEIRRAVMEDCRLYNITSIAFDPWNAAQLSNQLLHEGANMVEFVQGTRSYSAPTKELESLLLSERLDHGGNEVLTWMAHNLRLSRPDRNDNIMPTKRHSTGRIDGMTALIMAIGRSMAEDPTAGLDGYLSGPLVA